MPSIYKSKMNPKASAAKADKYKFRGKVYNTLAEYNAAKAAYQKEVDSKKRVVGYREKTGETHKSKSKFYESKTEKSDPLMDKTKFKTPLGKVFNTRDKMEVYKKDRIAKGLPY